jgi:hypothetical protein
MFLKCFRLAALPLGGIYFLFFFHQKQITHRFLFLFFFSCVLPLPFKRGRRRHPTINFQPSQSYGRGASNLDDLLSLTESLGGDNIGAASGSFNNNSHGLAGSRDASRHGFGYVPGAVSRLPVNSMRKVSGGGGGGGVNKEVLLGGSDCSMGSTPSTFRKIVNDQLLCLKCMCAVVRFADYKWDDTVDYMYFRNFWPEPERLSPKMQKRHGYAAYCCQCSWHSSQGVEHLPPDLRWSAQ